MVLTMALDISFVGIPSNLNHLLQETDADPGLAHPLQGKKILRDVVGKGPKSPDICEYWWEARAFTYLLDKKAIARVRVLTLDQDAHSADFRLQNTPEEALLLQRVKCV